MHGDPAYPLEKFLLRAFKGMNSHWECVEWEFGAGCRSYDAFLDPIIRMGLKLCGLRLRGILYKVGVFLTNCRTCCYGDHPFFPSVQTSHCARRHAHNFLLKMTYFTNFWTHYFFVAPLFVRTWTGNGYPGAKIGGHKLSIGGLIYSSHIIDGLTFSYPIICLDYDLVHQ